MICDKCYNDSNIKFYYKVVETSSKNMKYQVLATTILDKNCIDKEEAHIKCKELNKSNK